MAYFPFYSDMTGKCCLIVGGGTVALRKIEKILPYGASVTVVSKHISDGIRAIDGIDIIEKDYETGDEEFSDFVIAATDDRSVNALVSRNCDALKIPCNVVDDPALCSFIFPCLIKRGDLSIGISTSGSSPSAAIALKERFGKMIPERFGEILAWLNEERDEIKKTVKDEKERARILRMLFDFAMAKGAPLTEEETKEAWQ